MDGPVPSPTTYRACLVGKAGQVLAVHVIEAAGDAEAAEAAARLAKRHAVVLWQRDRFVRSLPASYPPVTT